MARREARLPSEGLRLGGIRLDGVPAAVQSAQKLADNVRQGGDLAPVLVLIALLMGWLTYRGERRRRRSGARRPGDDRKAK